MDALAKVGALKSPVWSGERRRATDHHWSRPGDRQVPLAGLMSAILQRVQIGICVVDETLQVVYANDAARVLMRESDFVDRESRLQLRSEIEQARLRKSVSSALAGRWALLSLGRLGTPALSVVPIDVPGHALLVFGMKPHSDELAISFFMQAHSMTVAEGFVLRGLVEGLTPKQIACQRGVALSTIRSQILRIRERTGTQNIRDLVRAVSCLPPVMPAGMLG